MRFIKPVGNYISGLHRGDQIAQQLGADFMKNEKTDTVVFLKCYDDEVANEYKNVYIDLMDLSLLLYQQDNIASHVKFIVNCERAYEYVKWRTERKIAVIPDSHINFENYLRPVPDTINTVGYVGSLERLSVRPDVLTNRFKEVDIKFKCLPMENACVSREMVCDFYKSLDVSVSFYKPTPKMYMPPEMKTHPRIVHPASFGIPSVCYPELGFSDAECWAPARSIEHLIKQVICFRDNMDVYQTYRDAGIDYADNYHIIDIAEMYKEL